VKEANLGKIVGIKTERSVIQPAVSITLVTSYSLQKQTHDKFY